MKTLVCLLAFLTLAATFAGAQEAALNTRIVAAARQQIGVTTEYDPAYKTLKYPGGDVPLNTGVCSDVVVRALRQVNVDLQKEVHEDMVTNFSAYPQKWNLKTPDKNIDHRRVLNLMKYFERHHLSLAEKLKLPEAYQAGDIVAWDLGSGVTHIGIVSDKRSGSTPLIIHNIGAGAKEEDVLFKYQIIGHYRLKENMASRSDSTLTTPTYRISIQGCEEYVVSCDDVKYVGVNKKNGKSITLTGKTVHHIGPDGVTPARFLGYEFKSGEVKYFVGEDGILRVTQGSKILVEEQGKWDWESPN